MVLERLSPYEWTSVVARIRVLVLRVIWNSDVCADLFKGRHSAGSSWYCLGPEDPPSLADLGSRRWKLLSRAAPFPIGGRKNWLPPSRISDRCPLFRRLAVSWA